MSNQTKTIMDEFKNISKDQLNKLENYIKAAKFFGGEYQSKNIPRSINVSANAWKCKNSHYWNCELWRIIKLGRWCPYC